MRARVPLLLTCALVSGCWKAETTQFPAGLEPLEDNTAPVPASTASETFPEDFSYVSGSAEDYNWVHLRGYVHASMSEVADAVRVPEVVVDRRRVDEFTITEDVEPEFEVSFVVHNVIHDILTVEFDVTWRAGAVLVDDTDAFAARYQKTYGSSLVDVLEGSILIVPVEDGITEIQLIEHLGATATSVEDVESYQQDLYASVVEYVHHGVVLEYVD